ASGLIIPCLEFINYSISILSSWRRERDSNPRYGFPYTRFPGVRLQPLGHLSVGERAGNIVIPERGATGKPRGALAGAGRARHITTTAIRPSKGVSHGTVQPQAALASRPRHGSARAR